MAGGARRKKGGAQWPEGYYPEHLRQHELFLAQNRAEQARVGWRMDIERQLGIRYEYWRDISYRVFPPQWMVDLGYHRPLAIDLMRQRQERQGREERERLEQETRTTERAERQPVQRAEVPAGAGTQLTLWEKSRAA